MTGNLTAKQVKELLAKSALPQRSGGMVSYNPVAQQKKVIADARSAQKAATDTPGEAMLSRLGGEKKAAGGSEGIMGKLLNNPIGKVVTGALSTLSVPLNYVNSGVKELSDLGNEVAGGLGFDVSTGETGASFSDFLRQGREGIGFGDIVHAQSSTAREHPNVGRIAGFAGDVALDPLTYLTFGAGKFAGQAGRIAAGEKVAAKLGEEAGAKVARLGVMGGSAAEREAAFAGMKGAEDLARPGLRLAGARIPGTEKIAEAVGTKLSKTRAAIGDTALGQGVRSVRAPKGLEEAFKVLARGEGDAGVAFDTIKHVRDQAAGEGMFTGKFGNNADKIARKIQKDGDGVSAFTALDEQLPGTHVGNAAAGEAFFTDAHDLASQSIPELGKRQGYAPHIWTPEARKALRGEANADLRKQIGMDVTEATGGAVKRSIHPGSKLTMPDGSTVEFVADTASGAVSARQINKKLGSKLGGVKVIENDLSKVLHPYITGMGESVGRAEATAKAGKISGLGQMVDAVDNAATKVAGNAEAKTLGRGAKTMSTHEAALSKQLGVDGATAQKAIVGQLDSQLKDAVANLKTAKAAEAQAGNASKGLAAERNKVTREAQQRVSALQGNVEGKIKNSIDAAKSYEQIDAAASATFGAKVDARATREAAQKDVADATKRLATAKRINASPKAGTAKAYDKVASDLKTMAVLARDSPEMRQTHEMLKKYANGVADLRDSHATNQALTQMQKAAAKGEIQPVLKKMIQDGYEQIGHSLLGADAPLVKKQLAEQLRHLQVAIDDPGMWRVVDKYTQYFKTWATSTVGFHVRNGMQAAFMNASDGVTVENMGRGAKLWLAFERNPRNFADHLPDWISKEQFDDALRAVYASGGGEGQFGAAELKIGQSKLINNKITRFSHKVGGKVEGMARMGMALDTVLGGGTMEEAAARITRIHFDYSQVSKFDAKMKRMIPFWTFLSRNVPLQVQQMFMRPKMYQAYRHLADNMGRGEEGDMIPLSWSENGAFQLTKGLFLQPDLAHLGVIADIGKLTTDPQRLLADANPIFKIPFETLIAKRKLFSDSTFKEGGVESVGGSGLAPFAPLLRALGLTDMAGDGTEVMNEKLAYAIRGMNPLLNQSQRILGDDPYYKDKRYQSILNQLGVPLKMLTEGQKKAEQKRRNRTSQNAVDPKTAALLAYSKSG